MYPCNHKLHNRAKTTFLLLATVMLRSSAKDACGNGKSNDSSRETAVKYSSDCYRLMQPNQAAIPLK